MATIPDLRAAIAEHPEIEEATRNTSFRVATFKVDGKGIIGVEKDRIHATFALTEADARRLADGCDLRAEPIARAGRPVGVRVELASLTQAQLRRLVAHALERASA